MVAWVTHARDAGNAHAAPTPVPTSNVVRAVGQMALEVERCYGRHSEGLQGCRHPALPPARPAATATHRSRSPRAARVIATRLESGGDKQHERRSGNVVLSGGRRADRASTRRPCKRDHRRSSRARGRVGARCARGVVALAPGQHLAAGSRSGVAWGVARGRTAWGHSARAPRPQLGLFASYRRGDGGSNPRVSGPPRSQT